MVPVVAVMATVVVMAKVVEEAKTLVVVVEAEVEARARRPERFSFRWSQRTA